METKNNNRTPFEILTRANLRGADLSGAVCVHHVCASQKSSATTRGRYGNSRRKQPGRILIPMTSMTDRKLRKVIRLHGLWLQDKPGGKFADLSDVDLSGVDLSGVDLSHAALRDTNLTGANLSGANFSGADMRGADTSNADMRDADMTNVYRSFADLRKLI